ncbi:MAG: glycosyltransferase family 2 protein [Actinomycetota bacterium]
MEDGDRSTPEHQVFEFAPRSADFCIGIPVINEGNRLREQLTEMRSLDLGADVIIADGGSTDGSVDPDFLRRARVRTLLVKTGPGFLSAQLRMFFAYAIRQGYRGIMTIDGNGKDGVEGLVTVRRGLEDGYDFVQGSRFVQGGTEENTPFDRKVGLRLIHAPIISRVAGFRYTDTTNGLRGWSRRVLVDPRVAPLRDVFQTYDLHYYLSARIPRLGYRVTEVPVRRSYPVGGGSTPSKISGLRGRIHILRLLARILLHRYDPPAPTPKRPSEEAANRHKKQPS